MDIAGSSCRRRFFVFCLVLVVLPSYASSSLEEVVVTAARDNLLASNHAVQKVSVTKVQLEREHALDLKEGLKTVPGVLIKDIRGKEGSQAWIQGIAGNRVLIAINGEPVSPSTGSTVDLTQIAVGNIKKIEVIKGASSVLYGSQAMGGVINVITAKPQAGFHGGLRADVGSYGKQNIDGKSYGLSRKRTNANISYANDWFYIEGTMNARFSDGFKQNYQLWPQQGADGYRINSTVLLGLTPTDNSEYSIRHEDYQQQDHTRLAQSKAGKKRYINKQDDAKRQSTHLRGRWFYQQGDVSLSALSESYENTSKPNNDAFVRVFTAPLEKLSLQWNHQINDNHVLSLGSSYFTESLKETKNSQGVITDELGGKKSRDNVDFYIQHDWQLGKFQITPGLRWQKDSDFGDQSVFALNTQYAISDSLSLRASFGQGYRVPNLKERWFVFDHSHLGYQVLGNADLTPEKSDSYQLSMAWQATQTLRLNVGLFYHALDNLIVEDAYLETLSNGVVVYQYQNIQQAAISGAELGLDWQSVSGFGINGSYTYLDGEDKKTSQRLKDKPRHQVKSKFSYDHGVGLNLSLIYSWQSQHQAALSDQQSPAWAQWDFKVSQALGKNFSLYGGVDNITNTQRDFTKPEDQKPVAGRLVYLGFELHY